MLGHLVCHCGQALLAPTELGWWVRVKKARLHAEWTALCEEPAAAVRRGGAGAQQPDFEEYADLCAAVISQVANQ